MFADRGEIQINVEFDLRDGRLRNLSYPHLAYRGINYQTVDDSDTRYPVLVQYR